MKQIILCIIMIILISLSSIAQTDSTSSSKKFDVNDLSTWKDNPNDVMKNIDEIWKKPANWDKAVEVNPNVLDDQKRAGDYFTKNPTKMSEPALKPKAISYFKNSFGYDLTLDGEIITLSPKGKPSLFKTSGVKASQLENFVNLPKGTKIKVDKDGFIWINDAKLSGELKYNRPAGENLGSFDIEKGSVNGKDVTGGKNIVIGGDLIRGKSKSFDGVTFDGQGEFHYLATKNILVTYNDIARMFPNIDELRDPGVQSVFSGINGFMTIKDSAKKGEVKLYQVEYEKADGTKATVWVTDHGTLASELVTGTEKIDDAKLQFIRSVIQEEKLTSIRRDFGARMLLYGYQIDLSTALKEEKISNDQYDIEYTWAKQQIEKIGVISAVREISRRPQFSEAYGASSYRFRLEEYLRNLDMANSAGRISRQRYEQERNWAQGEVQRYAFRPSQGSGVVVTQRNN